MVELGCGLVRLRFVCVGVCSFLRAFLAAQILFVANLPYIPTSTLSTLNKEVIDYEPLIALDGGEDGRLYIDKLQNDLKNIDSKELVLVLEVDTSHAESLLSSFTDWEDVKLEKDLVERDRYIVARK